MIITHSSRHIKCQDLVGHGHSTRVWHNEAGTQLCIDMTRQYLINDDLEMDLNKHIFTHIYTQTWEEDTMWLRISSSNFVLP